MSTVLWLLTVQGALGALDTLYYHEWRARLPAGVPGSRPELMLHAARDFLYAVLFGSLPWLAWRGGWAAVLALIILAEVLITLADFVVEDVVRKPLGGVFPGERVMHTVMAIIYGAALGYLVPVLLAWWQLPSEFAMEPAPVPQALRVALSLMAVGVFFSGASGLSTKLLDIVSEGPLLGDRFGGFRDYVCVLRGHSTRDLYAALQLPRGHWPWPRAGHLGPAREEP